MNHWRIEELNKLLEIKIQRLEKKFMAERYRFYSLRAHPCRLSLCLRRDSIVIKRLGIQT